MLSSAAATVLALALLWLVGLPFTSAGTVWIALPLILGAADIVLIPAVGSTVRPLPYGAAAEADARRVSMGVIRAVTYIRLALANAPAAFGVLGSVISASLLPAAIGIGIALVLTLVLVYPRHGVLAGVEQRLESGGVAAHLWDEPRARP